MREKQLQKQQQIGLNQKEKKKKREKGRTEHLFAIFSFSSTEPYDDFFSPDVSKMEVFFLSSLLFLLFLILAPESAISQ